MRYGRMWVLAVGFAASVVLGCGADGEGAALSVDAVPVGDGVSSVQGFDSACGVEPLDGVLAPAFSAEEFLAGLGLVGPPTPSVRAGGSGVEWRWIDDRGRPLSVASYYGDASAFETAEALPWAAPFGFPVFEEIFPDGARLRVDFESNEAVAEAGIAVEDTEPWYSLARPLGDGRVAVLSTRGVSKDRLVEVARSGVMAQSREWSGGGEVVGPEDLVLTGTQLASARQVLESQQVCLVGVDELSGGEVPEATWDSYADWLVVGQGWRDDGMVLIVGLPPAPVDDRPADVEVPVSGVPVSLEAFVEGCWAPVWEPLAGMSVLLTDPSGDVGGPVFVDDGRLVILDDARRGVDLTGEVPMARPGLDEAPDVVAWLQLRDDLLMVVRSTTGDQGLLTDLRLEVTTDGRVESTPIAGFPRELHLYQHATLSSGSRLVMVHVQGAESFPTAVLSLEPSGEAAWSSHPGFFDIMMAQGRLLAVEEASLLATWLDDGSPVAGFEGTALKGLVATGSGGRVLARAEDGQLLLADTIQGTARVVDEPEGCMVRLRSRHPAATAHIDLP